MSPSPTPTATPTEEPSTEDPLQEHLAVIIGVPTGVGLSILLIGTCVVWLACSSYLEHRRAMAEHYGGTRTTNLVRYRTCFLSLPPFPSLCLFPLPLPTKCSISSRNCKECERGQWHNRTLSLMTEYAYEV